MEIVIPYAPRPLQLSLHAEMQAKRWGVVVCHRRFGKTVWAINHILRDAIMCDRLPPGMLTWHPPIARRRTWPGIT
jgi:phage terminase large subunit